MPIDWNGIGIILAFNAPFYLAMWQMVIDLTKVKESVKTIGENVAEINNRLTKIEGCKYCLKARIESV